MQMATRKIVLSVGFVLIALLAAPTTVLAVGFGANFTYGYRTGTLGDVDDFFPDIDWTSNDISVGFTLDTAVASDRVFNYRMNLNYEHGIVEFNDSGDTVGSNGMAMDHIFGFGIIRTRSMRFWLGPAIRIAVAGIDDKGVDAIEADFGVGGVMGLNLHMGDAMSAGMTFGYQYNGSIFAFESFSGASGLDFLHTGGLHRISVGVTILFRSGGDVWEPRH